MVVEKQQRFGPRASVGSFQILHCRQLYRKLSSHGHNSSGAAQINHRLTKKKRPLLYLGCVAPVEIKCINAVIARIDSFPCRNNNTALLPALMSNIVFHQPQPPATFLHGKFSFCYFVYFFALILSSCLPTRPPISCESEAWTGLFLPEELELREASVLLPL